MPTVTVNVPSVVATRVPMDRLAAALEALLAHEAASLVAADEWATLAPYFNLG